MIGFYKRRDTLEDHERWTIISTYDNYAVSSFGRVINLNTGKYLKPQTSERGGGYVFINLYKNKQRRNVNIHILVATHFIGPCPVGYEVHHKDGIRTNPHVDNLEYLTTEDHGKTRRKEKTGKDIVMEFM